VDQSAKLVQVLRTLIATADKDNVALFLHFNTPPKKEDMKQDAMNLDLNKLMQNVEGEQFDYSSFKAAYDTDPRIKTMVNNFNETGIEPKTANTISDQGQQTDDGTDEIAQMAKSATDLGDQLT